MIDTDIAAVLTFTALGANLLGAVLLLLLNAGSRSVRWYMPFHVSVILWLLAQGMDLVFPAPLWEAAAMFSVVLLPLMFLLFGWFEHGDRPGWHALVLLLIAGPAMPIVMSGLYRGAPEWQQLVSRIWMLGGWIGGSVLLAMHGRMQAKRIGAQPYLRRKLVLLGFILIAPVCVVIAMFLDGPAFILYGMPIVTILVMCMIFYGITRMQLYDVEVRVRRTGDIATETGQLERLAVLGEMSATLAHEVRNPLTGVRSLAQRLASEDVSEEKRRKYGAVILEETSRLERLVNNLLELSRRGSSQRPASTAVPLEALFEDLALLAASRAERARVQIVTESNGVSVGAPREVLAQVLLNLLLNAVAHSPQNSVVKLAALQRDDAVDIVVRDHGGGVPASERERIFDPFYTTGVDGTGLGLSVVRHLAREQGWRIEVSEAPGGGAAFTLSV